jgi:hypothetical protein
MTTGAAILKNLRWQHESTGTMTLCELPQVFSPTDLTTLVASRCQHTVKKTKHRPDGLSRNYGIDPLDHGASSRDLSARNLSRLRTTVKGKRTDAITVPPWHSRESMAFSNITSHCWPTSGRTAWAALAIQPKNELHVQKSPGSQWKGGPAAHLIGGSPDLGPSQIRLTRSQGPWEDGSSNRSR